jgi:hypothetical protein
MVSKAFSGKLSSSHTNYEAGRARITAGSAQFMKVNIFQIWLHSFWKWNITFYRNNIPKVDDLHAS